MSKENSSKRVELEFPIEIDGEEGKSHKITYLVLKRLKAKHLKGISDENFQSFEEGTNPYKLVPLIAASSGFPVETIDEVDLRDLIAMVPEIIDFLLPPQAQLETGDGLPGK